jgi:hypothetical protein
VTADETLGGWQEASEKHDWQKRNYTASLRPGKRPGRPKGAKDRKDRSPQRGSIDPEQAAMAYQLSQDQFHWLHIAKQLNAPYNLSDPTEKARARQWVRERIHRGKINSQHRPPPSSDHRYTQKGVGRKLRAVSAAFLQHFLPHKLLCSIRQTQRSNHANAYPSP